MISTVKILAFRALNKPCQEDCIEWATQLLAAGHETLSTHRLASQRQRCCHFEVTKLQDRILVELDVSRKTNGEAILDYAAEVLLEAVCGTTELNTAISIVKDLYVWSGHSLHELFDFYLLHFAGADLKIQEYQHYWPNATESNIVHISRQRAQQFLSTR